MKTLAEKIAVMQAALEGKQIQRKVENDWEDCVNCPPCWNWEYRDYRIKPTPKRVPLTYEDWDSLVWWLRPSNQSSVYLLTGFHSLGIYLCDDIWTYSQLFNEKWQRSRDRKTWEPCWKEEI